MSFDKILGDIKDAVVSVGSSKLDVSKAQEAVDKAKAACEKTTAEAELILKNVVEAHEKAVTLVRQLHDSFKNQLTNVIPGINK